MGGYIRDSIKLSNDNNIKFIKIEKELFKLLNKKEKNLNLQY